MGRYRTKPTRKVVTYLAELILAGEGETTLKKVVNETGLKYQTVWMIVGRLEADECLKIDRYKHVLSEGGVLFPHAIISLKKKKYKKRIAKKLLWLRNTSLKKK